MTPVTLPRELAESLLTLMTRTVLDGHESVPIAQWLVFANALDKAMHPKTAQDAPGATRALAPVSAPIAGPCGALGAFQAQDEAIMADDLTCRFCHTAPVREPGHACGPCIEALLADVASLESDVHLANDWNDR